MAAPIDLEALRTLDAIARRGSYAAAAEELGKVPSGVSYVIQNLEERLGVTLFVKQGRRAAMTVAAQHLLEEGRLILEAVDRLAERTRTLANGWEPRLRIAIDSMFNTAEMFGAIDDFLQACPDVEIDLREEVMSGGWEVLIEDQVDLLLGAADPVPRHRGILARPLAMLDRVFAVAREHALAAHQRPIPESLLREQRAVVVHDSTRSGVAWSKGRINTGQVFYVPTVDCKIRAQLAGIGVGYLPRARVQPYLQSGDLVEIEIENPPHTELTPMYIAWKQGNHGKGLALLRDCFLARAPVLGL